MKPFAIDFYAGHRLDTVLSAWREALRTMHDQQGKHVLHRVADDKMCVFGVLCNVLDLPAKPLQTKYGLVLAYADIGDKDGEYHVDRLPDRLLRFLTAKNKTSFAVELDVLRTDAPPIFQRACIECETTPKIIMRMVPTYGNLNDLGVSFRTFAQILTTPAWRAQPKAQETS